MTLLLDTHVFLWFLSGDKKLPKLVKEKIIDMNQSCFLSIASLWEIAIKKQLGKLELGFSLQELFEFIDRNQIEIIPINYEHLSALEELPNHHNDPFDRMILSQAISEDLTVITHDKQFEKYNIKHIWI